MFVYHLGSHFLNCCPGLGWCLSFYILSLYFYLLATDLFIAIRFLMCLFRMTNNIKLYVVALCLESTLVQFLILWGRKKRSLHSLPSRICSSCSVALLVHGKIVNPTKNLKQSSSQSERSKAMLRIQTQTDYQIEQKSPINFCRHPSSVYFFAFHNHLALKCHTFGTSSKIFGQLFRWISLCGYNASQILGWFCNIFFQSNHRPSHIFK